MIIRKKFKETAKEDLLVRASLYEPFEIEIDDFDNIVELLKGNAIIICFCLECNAQMVFRVERKNKLFIPPNKTLSRIPITDDTGVYDEDDSPVMNVNRTYYEELKEKRFHDLVSKNKITTLNYNCAMDSSHIYSVILKLSMTDIMKIGQFPSYRDSEIPSLEQYRKLLGDKAYYPELIRAISLFNNNVGIGSFVYLRRIIEKLIIEVSKSVIEDGGISEEDFEYRMSSDRKKYRNGIEEKIKLLTGYLPSILTDNPKLYGIISKGVHEWSEMECKDYFPVIKNCIILILQDLYSKGEKEKALIETEKSLIKIISKSAQQETK